MCSPNLFSASPAQCSCGDAVAGGAGAGAVPSAWGPEPCLGMWEGVDSDELPNRLGGYLLAFPGSEHLLSDMLSSLQLSFWIQRNHKRSWAGPHTRQTG